MNWMDEIEDRMNEAEKMVEKLQGKIKAINTELSETAASRLRIRARLDKLEQLTSTGPPHRIWIWPEHGGGYRAGRKHPHEVPPGEDLVWLTSCMLTHLGIEPPKEPTPLHVTVTRAT